MLSLPLLFFSFLFLPLLFLILQVLKIFVLSEAGGCWERLSNPDLEREAPRGGEEGQAAGQLKQQGDLEEVTVQSLERGVARKKALICFLEPGL